MAFFFIDISLDCKGNSLSFSIHGGCSKLCAVLGTFCLFICGARDLDFLILNDFLAVDLLTPLMVRFIFSFLFEILISGLDKF
mmetsp:Transcript_31175/g.27561  ORF Transcript_31175/g.27561 Transcript_31175/m.27561 type:complete len:83 (-) Transcript_31175:83-331(-)